MSTRPLIFCLVALHLVPSTLLPPMATSILSKATPNRLPTLHLDINRRGMFNK